MHDPDEARSTAAAPEVRLCRTRGPLATSPDFHPWRRTGVCIGAVPIDRGLTESQFGLRSPLSRRGIPVSNGSGRTPARQLPGDSLTVLPANADLVS